MHEILSNALKFQIIQNQSLKSNKKKWIFSFQQKKNIKKTIE